VTRRTFADELEQAAGQRQWNNEQLFVLAAGAFVPGACSGLRRQGTNVTAEGLGLRRGASSPSTASASLPGRPSVPLRPAGFF
jgi:hypothetical protein